MKERILKLLNRISIAVLALAVVATVFSISVPRVAVQAWDGVNATTFASGSGTQSSPYLIRTPGQMGYFLSSVAGGVTYEGKYIKLAANVDLTGGSLTAAGTFSGTFDGCGYSVTTPFALFYSIGATGTVKRLICVGTESMISSPLTDFNYGLIESCLVRGTVDDDQIDDGTVGMVCDENYSTGIVRNCAGVGSLSATGDDCSVEIGLVGWNRSGTIEHCYAALTMSGSAPGRYNYVHMDPIAGYGSGTLKDCYYDSTLYTSATTQAVGSTTGEMKSDAFLDVMNGSLYVGSVWAEDTAGINDGYPIPVTCYEGTVDLSHTDEKVSTYHTSPFGAELTPSASGTVYYTLDGSDPRSSSTRKTYTLGSTVSITGNVTVRAVLYYGGQYGAVSTQKLIYLPGSGTESAPYQISTKLQLDAVRLDLTAHYRLMNDLTFTDADYALDGVAPGGWIPIGEGGTAFSGSFDGQGHAIYGLAGSNGGMFDYNRGTIDSLRLVDHRLSANATTGAVADYNSGSVLRCYTKSAFTVGDLPNTAPFTSGGVVGSNSGTVQYCRNDGVVFSTAQRYAHVYVGGITGSGGAEYCYNTGLLVAGAYPGDAADYVIAGGISATGDVYNCRNDGDVYINTGTGYNAYVAGMSAWYGGTHAGYCVAGQMDVTVTYDYTSQHLSKGVFTFSSHTSCYSLSDAASQEVYPELDFDTVWMMTANGPVPQGVMDGEGRCILAKSYVAPTCEKAGLATYTDYYGASVPSQQLAMGHSYSAWTAVDGTDTHTRTCTRANCGVAQTESHAWEQTKVTAPTCTADGSVEMTCATCSAQKTLVGELALGHKYTKYTSNHDAVWPQNGTETATCDNGCKTKDTRTIADCVDYGTCGTNLTWKLSSDGTLTISGTGAMKDYGYNSSSYSYIDPEWDDLSDYITAVVVEQGVTSVGGCAFAGCDNLTAVSLPEGLTVIGESAFSGDDQLTGITLPQSLTAIEASAFHQTGLTRVVLPANVVSIGKMAFGRCYDLAAVELPSGLQSIGTNAFYATALTEVTLPSGLKSLGGGAFRSCRGLSTIAVAAGNTSFVSVDGVIYNADKTSVLAYPYGKAGSSYTILPGVTGIGAECFADCDKLTEVIIPDGVKSIGSSAFYGTGLTAVDLPESLTTLSDYSFASCKKLTSVVIPEGITNIPYMAFDSCHSLASVTLPSTVTALGDWAFYLCALTDIDLPDGLLSMGRHALESNKLTHIVIPASVTSIGDYALENSRLRLIEFLGGPPATMSNYVFDSGVTAVCLYPDDAGWTEENMLDYGGDLLWRRSNIGAGLSWDLVDGVLTVRGNGAMRNFTGWDDTPWYPLRDLIEEIVVEEGVTVIGGWAFGGDTGTNGTTLSTTYYKLTKVSLPDSLQAINGYAFANAYELTEVIIPKGVTFIDPDDTFMNCQKLASIQVAQDNTTYSSKDGLLLSKDGSILYSCPMGKSGVCVIPAGVNTIQAYAFYVCPNLTKVIIPAGVTAIEKNGFYILDKYCEIVFQGNAPTTLGSYTGSSTNIVWYPADNTTWTSTKMNQFSTRVTWKMLPLATGVCGENLTWSLSGDGVLTVSGTGAMENYDSTSTVPWYGYASRIKSVVIQSGATTVGARAFMNCTAMTAVEIPSTVTAIGEWAFANCNQLPGVTIPASVSEIGSWAFYSCSSLTEVTVPEGVEEVAGYTFYQCSALKTLHLPSTLTAIREWGFSSCAALTEVTIPAGVTVLEDSAFGGCNQLVKVNFGGTQKQWDSNVTVGSNVFVYKANFYFAPCSGHSFVVYQPDQAATCQQNATEKAECEFCYETDTRDIADSKAEHVFENYVCNNDATCQQNATETGTCKYGCGTEDTRDIAGTKLEHVPGEWITDVEPTATTEGSRYKICINDGCGIELEREAIPTLVIEIKNGLHKDENGVWKYYEDNAVDTSYTGLHKHTDGYWYFVSEGVLDWDFTGLWKHTNGSWYYVEDGELNWGYTGAVEHTNGKSYFVTDGKIVWGLKGLHKGDDGVWYYLSDSTVQTAYTGLVKHTDGSWYYVADGVLDLSYTGLWKHTNGGWYYMEDGVLDWNFTGLWKHTNGGWYYVEKGKLNWGFTGAVEHTNGKSYFVTDGKIVWYLYGLYEGDDGVWYYLSDSVVKVDYTGLVKHTNGSWYYVADGVLDWSFTGLWKHTNGYWFYVEKGKLNWGYTGLVEHTNGKWYYVEDGEINWKFNGTVDGKNVVNGVAVN